VKKSIKPRSALLFLLLLASCGPGGGSIDSNDPGPESWPTNADVVAYLDGQPIPTLKSGSREVKIRPVGIEALSVEPHGSPTADGSWATRISLIYNSGRARFTIDAVVEHRLIEGRRTFTAFLVKRVQRL
jgi:hypothetical protein